MKRFLSLAAALCIVLTAVFSLVGCEGKADSDVETESQSVEAKIDIDVTEATFKGWINEFNTSPEDYIGKTVRLEGIMFAGEAKNGKTYYTVYRDGCCANDRMYSIEFMSSQEKPENGAWVEVVGTYSDYTEGPDTYYHLINTKITEKTERGQEALGL